MLPDNDYVTGKLWNLRGYMYENLGYPFCGFRAIKPKLHVLILWFQTPQLIGALRTGVCTMYANAAGEARLGASPASRVRADEYFGRGTSERGTRSFETPRRKDLKLVAV